MPKKELPQNLLVLLPSDARLLLPEPPKTEESDACRKAVTACLKAFIEQQSTVRDDNVTNYDYPDETFCTLQAKATAVHNLSDPNCLGQLTWTLPDGRKQTFSFLINDSALVETIFPEPDGLSDSKQVPWKSARQQILRTALENVESFINMLAIITELYLYENGRADRHETALRKVQDKLLDSLRNLRDTF